MVYNSIHLSGKGDFIMKKHKKAIVSILTMALIFSILPLWISNTSKANESEYDLSNPRIENGTTTWDCIYFGSYWQSEYEPIKEPDDPKGNVIYTDADGTEFICSGRYFKIEPIKWRVLSVDSNDAFLLSDKTLEYDSYNRGWHDVTWENCTLRDWLNDDFYNTAFSGEEQSAIKTTMVINEDTQNYGTDGGNNTDDKIYLLSLKEVTDASYGFATGYTKSETRIITGTDFSCSEAYPGWWLRSPGSSNLSLESPMFVATVESKGNININGDEPIGYKNVRPVLHLDLSSNLWTKADTVSCKNLPEEQAMPTPTPTNTPKPTTKPTTSPTQKPIPTQSTTMTPTQAPKVTPSPSPTAKPTKVTAPGKVKKLTAKNKKKKSVALSWKKVKGANGYQIQYVKQDGFSDKKSIYTKKTKYTVKKLRKKKTYPFRVRAYTLDGKKKVYGKWSAVKRVKIKK